MSCFQSRGSIADVGRISVYSLHLKAGNSHGDVATRLSELKSLMKTVRADPNYKNGELIMGDFNYNGKRDDAKQWKKAWYAHSSSLIILSMLYTIMVG